MPDYEVPRSIIATSLTELGEIYRWVRERERPDNPITVLIGGWAVYCYNPWYGSIDIDLVTNAGTRQHLMRHLERTRGFIKRRNPPFVNSIVKIVPPDGEIIIDFISRNHNNPFEGRDDTCPMNILAGRTVEIEISAGLSVIIPERSLLLLLKLKAAWDRECRIIGGNSHDLDWEKGKLRKDRADILSLIDSMTDELDLDFMFLGDKFQQYPFLREVLTKIPDDVDALQMYGRMDRETAQRIISDILRLVE